MRGKSGSTSKSKNKRHSKRKNKEIKKYILIEFNEREQLTNNITKNRNNHCNVNML